MLLTVNNNKIAPGNTLQWAYYMCQCNSELASLSFHKQHPYRYLQHLLVWSLAPWRFDSLGREEAIVETLTISFALSLRPLGFESHSNIANQLA